MTLLRLFEFSGAPIHPGEKLFGRMGNLFPLLTDDGGRISETQLFEPSAIGGHSSSRDVAVATQQTACRRLAPIPLREVVGQPPQLLQEHDLLDVAGGVRPGAHRAAFLT